jgi:hypothetical protein
MEMANGNGKWKIENSGKGICGGIGRLCVSCELQGIPLREFYSQNRYCGK